MKNEKEIQTFEFSDINWINSLKEEIEKLKIELSEQKNKLIQEQERNIQKSQSQFHWTWSEEWKSQNQILNPKSIGNHQLKI